MSRASSGGSKKEEESKLEMMKVRKLVGFQSKWLPSQKRDKSKNPSKEMDAIGLP